MKRTTEKKRAPGAAPAAGAGAGLRAGSVRVSAADAAWLAESAADLGLSPAELVHHGLRALRQYIAHGEGGLRLPVDITLFALQDPARGLRFVDLVTYLEARGARIELPAA